MYKDCRCCGETYNVSPKTAKLIDQGYLPQLGRCTWKITGHTLIETGEDEQWFIGVPMTKVYHLIPESN
jgi:hypothetical protein